MRVLKLPFESRIALLLSHLSDAVWMCLDVHAQISMGRHTRRDSHARILHMDIHICIPIIIHAHMDIQTWISKHGYPLTLTEQIRKSFQSGSCQPDSDTRPAEPCLSVSR